jgi:heptosyltransferase-3
MQHLAVAEYNEIWVPRAAVPLIQFGEASRALSSTALNLMGLGDLPSDAVLASYLKSFDHIVSWYGANRPEFRAAMEAVGVPCDFYPALPGSDHSGHATDFFAEQVGARRGLQPRINVIPTEPRDSIVIHPFSGSRRKNWPLDSFRELASTVKTAVEWCAGPEETLGQAKRFDDLADLSSWIAGARLYIGNDSGITHLAAATGVPVLAIFVVTDPEIWAPRGDNATVLRSPTVKQVIEEASRLLG